MNKLCMGTWQLEESFGKITYNEAENLLRYAKKSGIKSYDTARVYGKGKVEQTLMKVIDDNDFIITKVPASNKPKVEESLSISSFYRFNTIKEDIDRSINALGRKPDVLLLHNWSYSWDNTEDAEKVLTFLKELKTKEKFKYFGVSLPNNYGENITEWLLQHVDFIECPFNETNRWIIPYINRLKEYRVKLALRSIFQTGEFFKKNSEGLTIQNELLSAYNLADFLIIGMSSYDSINKNLRILQGDE